MSVHTVADQALPSIADPTKPVTDPATPGDQRLDLDADLTTPPAGGAAKKAAKKTAAKKTTAKKSAAKKTTAKKAPAKRTKATKVTAEPAVEIVTDSATRVSDDQSEPKKPRFRARMPRVTSTPPPTTADDSWAGTNSHSTFPGAIVGRYPILDPMPVVDHGRWPAKCVPGEVIPVSATVFREGHDAVTARVVLTSPQGEVTYAPMACVDPGMDRWSGTIQPTSVGDWTFSIEAWGDRYITWLHDAAVKIEAGVDVDLMLVEGVRILRAAQDQAERTEQHHQALLAALAGLNDDSRPAIVRYAAGADESVQQALREVPLRDKVSVSGPHPLRVQRELALTGAWYEMFPRSVGATRNDDGTWNSGTLRTAAEDLPRIAAMGFNVVYLTPIHPIGSQFRKGRNNSLSCEPGDPGSPYAIGSSDGGHDAIHPDLGTFDDFDFFVDQATKNGLEVAMDLALQCSPDHPWVTAHPEWFATRADGTIAYAENPPKKYQDIYPLYFDNDPRGLAEEILRVLRVWISHGVTCFRVDNPHTKPVEFWEWLIAEVNTSHPEVIFLSEAFTKPAMMRTLAKIGFHQSYTYFTWRNTAQELKDYVNELTTSSDHAVEGKTGTADYMRPSFWPTTHDILTPLMEYGQWSAFKSRAVLAATLSPTWGMYSGYELVEHQARPGVQEQLDNEKYEYRPRDYATAVAEGRSIEPWITAINKARRDHVALQRLRGVTFHHSDDPEIMAYSKHVAAQESPTGRASTVICVVNLDPYHARETTIHLSMAALDLHDHQSFVVRDVLSGQSWTWGQHVWVRLDGERPAHLCWVDRHEGH